jgi:hypothetical protein
MKEEGSSNVRRWAIRSIAVGVGAVIVTVVSAFVVPFTLSLFNAPPQLQQTSSTTAIAASPAIPTPSEDPNSTAEPAGTVHGATKVPAGFDYQRLRDLMQEYEADDRKYYSSQSSESRGAFEEDHPMTTRLFYAIDDIGSLPKECTDKGPRFDTTAFTRTFELRNRGTHTIAADELVLEVLGTDIELESDAVLYATKSEPSWSDDGYNPGVSWNAYNSSSRSLQNVTATFVYQIWACYTHLSVADLACCPTDGMGQLSTRTYSKTIDLGEMLPGRIKTLPIRKLINESGRYLRLFAYDEGSFYCSEKAFLAGALTLAWDNNGERTTKTVSQDVWYEGPGCGGGENEYSIDLESLQSGTTSHIDMNITIQPQDIFEFTLHLRARESLSVRARLVLMRMGKRVAESAPFSTYFDRWDMEGELAQEVQIE